MNVQTKLGDAAPSGERLVGELEIEENGASKQAAQNPAQQMQETIKKRRQPPETQKPQDPAFCRSLRLVAS
jgi:hypothetical protein